MPIGDTKERQNSIVPANESQAIMISLVRSGSRLRGYHTSSPSTSYKPIKQGRKANILSFLQTNLRPARFHSWEAGPGSSCLQHMRFMKTTKRRDNPEHNQLLQILKGKKMKRLHQPHQPNYAPKKLPHPISVNEQHANWRQAG
ncbi:hypothetical protein J6590_082134 [Homalodisca vitripennis]|nr:hypothetical protein J6590_082134 [Homalodisca vitripennis]